MHRRGKKGHLLLLHPPPCSKSRNSPRGRSGPGKSEKETKTKEEVEEAEGGAIGNGGDRMCNAKFATPFLPPLLAVPLDPPANAEGGNRKEILRLVFFFKRLSIAELAQKSHCKYPYDTIRANFQSQRTPSAYFPSSDGSTNCESPMSSPRPTADQGAEGGEMDEPAVTPAPTVRASRWQHKRREVHPTMGRESERHLPTRTCAPSEGAASADATKSS